MTAFTLWFALAATGPAAFPAPTQFAPPPFAVRLDADALAVAICHATFAATRSRLEGAWSR